MAKRLEFHKDNENRKLQEIMQADFPLPEQAEKAKNEAFAKIRKMADTGQITQKEAHRKKAGRLRTIYKTAIGMTAAAGIF